MFRLLIPHIDINKDSYLSAKELEIWVRDKYESLYITEDVDAMFRETDVNFDNEISWEEHMWRHYAIRDNGGFPLLLAVLSSLIILGLFLKTF